jgi:hypothetical protein
MYYAVAVVVGILIGAVGGWFITKNNPKLLKVESVILDCDKAQTQKLDCIVAAIDCISIKLGCKVDPTCIEPKK